LDPRGEPPPLPSPLSPSPSPSLRCARPPFLPYARAPAHGDARPGVAACGPGAARPSLPAAARRDPASTPCAAALAPASAPCTVALAPAPPLPPGGARPAPCSLLRRRSSAPTWFTRPLLAPPRWPCPRHGGPAPRRGSRPLRTASRPSVWLAWPRRGLALPRLPLTRSRVRNPTRAVIILGF
jgi:hypothetical protein